MKLVVVVVVVVVVVAFSSRARIFRKMFNSYSPPALSFLLLLLF